MAAPPGLKTKLFLLQVKKLVGIPVKDFDQDQRDLLIRFYLELVEPALIRKMSWHEIPEHEQDHILTGFFRQFLRDWQSYRDYGEGPFCSCITAFRRSFKRLRLFRSDRPPIRNLPDGFDCIDNNACSPDEPALQEELHTVVWEFIGSLPCNFRDALRYRYIEGYSRAKCAETMGVSHETISRWCNEAKGRILDHVNQVFSERLYHKTQGDRL